MPRPSAITIDLEALKHNAGVAGRLADSKKLMAAVKADAYGHGLIPCSKALEPLVHSLAVAVCEEAVLLREAGIQLPILVLDGPFDRVDIEVINELKLMSVVHSQQQLDLLLPITDKTAPPSVWVKVDTGMHRLGFQPKDLPDVIAQLNGVPDVVVMSHFADGEDPGSELTRRQLDRWNRLGLPIQDGTSFANSAGLINGLAPACEWVRPGIMLYGAPHQNGQGHELLRPVMSFRSAVMAVRTVETGETVGYGGRWQAPRVSRIATIPVGYGDGYPRSAKDGTPVLIGQTLCPLAGRVSMDMITVDVTDCHDCEVGTPVELWGQTLPVNRVAEQADTIGYELLTRMTSRVPRHWRP